MNLSESYNKNKKKHLLKEITATGATGTFVGGAGDIIDQLFAGPFHPIFGNIEKLLNQQIDNNIIIRMWTDDITPPTDQDFIDLDWKYEYDHVSQKDNSKFKSKSDTEMQSAGIEIKYDDSVKKFMNIYISIDDKDKWKTNIDYEYKNDTALKLDKSKFKNASETETQLVDIGIKYDEIIDKTKENKKFINDTNGWKSIYDVSKTS